MARETLLNLLLTGVLVLAIVFDTTRTIRRAAVWYGKALLRLITFGTYPGDELGPLERPVIGAFGLCAFLGVLVYTIYNLTTP